MSCHCAAIMGGREAKGGHKTTWTCYEIVPHTGKLALSVSKDGTMKMWNLVEGTPM